MLRLIVYSITNMLTLALLGVASTVATEVVTWLNKILSGTVLKGLGAFILSLVVSVAIASGQVILAGPGVMTWAQFIADLAQIWAVSQVVFVLVIQKLNLDLPSTSSS